MPRNHLLSTASLITSLIGSLVLSHGCTMESDWDIGMVQGESETSLSYDALARYWAPRFYHDTDSTEYKSDYLTKINFDGDYISKNNWENLGPLSTVPAYVYYSVVESTTHYFLGYYTFHPRDWCDTTLVCTEHENDLEGVLVVVRKDAGNGTLVAAVTEAHGQLYQYAYASGLSTGSDNVDGTISLHGTHPRMYIEAKGHGVYNCDSRCTSAPGGDGIVYTVGDVAQSPDSGSGNWTRVFTYQLIPLDETLGDQGLWTRRNSICDTCTFSSWGHFRGDLLDSQNSATTPWSWDDDDDGEAFSGALLCDPAQLIDTHLNGTPVDSGFSHTYTFNPYATHVLEIQAVRSDVDRDPDNASDIYVRVTAPGASEGSDVVIDQRAFKKNSATAGTWYSWARGAFDAEGQHRFGATVTRHHFCRRGTPAVTLEVFDADDNEHDAMGSVTCTSSCDHLAGIDLGDSRVKFRLTVNP